MIETHCMLRLGSAGVHTVHVECGLLHQAQAVHSHVHDVQHYAALLEACLQYA